MRKIYLTLLLYMLLISNVCIMTVEAASIGMETTNISAKEIRRRVPYILRIV